MNPTRKNLTSGSTRIACGDRVNLSVRRLVNSLEQHVEKYREALQQAALVVAEEERNLLSLHIEGLEQIVKLLSRNGEWETLLQVLALERRAFGWSYLSGAHGERVETAFHSLASLLEQVAGNQRSASNGA